MNYHISKQDVITCPSDHFSSHLLHDVCREHGQKFHQTEPWLVQGKFLLSDSSGHPTQQHSNPLSRACINLEDMKAKQNITNQQPNLSPCGHRIFFRPFPAGNCHRDKLMRQNRSGAAAESKGSFSNDVSNIVDFVPLCAELDLSYFLCLWVITPAPRCGHHL